MCIMHELNDKFLQVVWDDAGLITPDALQVKIV
jgi:hypothetical protein